MIHMISIAKEAGRQGKAKNFFIQRLNILNSPSLYFIHSDDDDELKQHGNWLRLNQARMVAPRR